MKILQINTVLNSGSSGRIAEHIGKLVILSGNESYIAYGRKGNVSQSGVLKVGNRADFYYHILVSRLFDNHGFASEKPTKKLIKEIEILDPDVIHLHNIHGYFLNIDVLFSFLKRINKPIVWTFHDCWPFTGHCSHYQYVKCEKWHTGCKECPNIRAYPKSWYIDHSEVNYKKKKELFTGFEKMVLISPSHWLADELRNSFMKEYNIQIIPNGVDLEIFKPYANNEAIRRYYFGKKKIILGVASVWTEKKGLVDFMKLHSRLSDNSQIILIGLTKKQIANLPPGIIGITRTENIEMLAQLYSGADIFINPTYVDNFPTTNIEALACGTPVITYDTGGSAESIDNYTGIKVAKGKIDQLIESINTIYLQTNKYTSELCRKRAEQFYNSNDRFSDYIKTYEKLMKTA